MRRFDREPVDEVEFSLRRGIARLAPAAIAAA